MAEIEQLRDLARAFYRNEPLPCPKHPGTMLSGSFVQATYADHIFLECPKDKETITISQRPKQQQFNPHQIEGLVVFLQEGDKIRCYRCQSNLSVDQHEEPPGSGRVRFEFTCVRCLSYGFWEGNPAEASIESPTISRSA